MTVQRGQMRSALDAPAIIDSHVNVPLTYTRSQKTFESSSNRNAVGEGIYTAKMGEPAIMNSARRPPKLPNGRKEPVRASVLETRSSKSSTLSSLILFTRARKLHDEDRRSGPALVIEPPHRKQCPSKIFKRRDYGSQWLLLRQSRHPKARAELHDPERREFELLQARDKVDQRRSRPQRLRQRTLLEEEPSSIRQRTAAQNFHRRRSKTVQANSLRRHVQAPVLAQAAPRPPEQDRGRQLPERCPVHGRDITGADELQGGPQRRQTAHHLRAVRPQHQRQEELAPS